MPQINYYVCDGDCPSSGDTFAGDSSCGGGCDSGCDCKEANTGNIGNTPIGYSPNEFISKTRGVPSAGSTNYGPRGQRQAFRDFQGNPLDYIGNIKRTSNIDPRTYPMSTRSVQGGQQIMNSPGWRRGEVSTKKGFRRFAGDDRGTMMTMSVTKLVMGYLAVGLTAFVVGYSIMKGKDLAQ
jgi:hypothetical protein